MQDKQSGQDVTQGHNYGNERREPTFGDLPLMGEQSVTRAAQSTGSGHSVSQGHGDAASTSQHGYTHLGMELGNFSPLEDEQADIMGSAANAQQAQAQAASTASAASAASAAAQTGEPKAPRASQALGAQNAAASTEAPQESSSGEPESVYVQVEKQTKEQAEESSGSDSDSEPSSAPQGNFLYQWREQRRAAKEALRKEKEMRKAGLLPPISLWRRIWNGIKYLFSLGLKLTLVGICISVVLFIYFDAVVIDGYEVDDKWVLPAVVYSRPLELYPDQRLSLKQMVYELELLQYRKVESPRRPGEYAVNEKNGRLVLIKRPFSFPDGEEKQMSVLVEFDDKRVERIVNAETMQELAFMRMDPVLLDRINRINPEEDRIFISLNEVPPQLITTLLEIEDRAYYQHFGINPVAIARAFVKNMVAGHVVEGGSTITQQLVKNYFLTNERSYSRKLKEIFMAIAMNHRYTKDQILEA